MGDFRIVIEAVGGHGCERNAKEGETFYGCASMECPDCQLREFLNSPRFRSMVKRATLTHWPGEADEVVDEYVSEQYGVKSTRVKGHF